MSLSVISEPRVYGPHSPYSFFRDQQRSLVLADASAQRRLVTHLREVAVEIDSGSVEGRRALREFGEELRGDGLHGAARDRVVLDEVRERSVEFRAATSSTLAGFTTPQWIISEFAMFRATQRTFADQCTPLPMPGVGLTIHVPRFTSASSAGVQTESVTVTELDPSATDNQENVQTISGQIITSQQLVDRTRSMPDGPSFDLVTYTHLKDAYDQALNNYVLGKAMGLGAQIPGQTTWSDLGTFYQDLSTAREKITDTNGIHQMPTHLFMHTDLYGYLTRQVDSSKRPYIVPQFFPGEPQFSEGDPNHPQDGASRWRQFTGTVAPGVLMWFVDQTIPNTASNNYQWIVSRPETILVWEGEPVVRTYSDTIANQLQAVIQLYSYAACVPRWPGATAVVTGNAYPTTSI